jgi:hypothetical protein
LELVGALRRDAHAPGDLVQWQALLKVAPLDDLALASRQACAHHPPHALCEVRSLDALLHGDGWVYDHVCQP